MLVSGDLLRVTMKASSVSFSGTGTCKINKKCCGNLEDSDRLRTVGSSVYQYCLTLGCFKTRQNLLRRSITQVSREKMFHSSFMSDFFLIWTVHCEMVIFYGWEFRMKAAIYMETDDTAYLCLHSLNELDSLFWLSWLPCMVSPPPSLSLAHAHKNTYTNWQGYVQGCRVMDWSLLVWSERSTKCF